MFINHWTATDELRTRIGTDREKWIRRDLVDVAQLVLFGHVVES